MSTDTQPSPSTSFIARHFTQDKAKQLVYGMRHTMDDGSKEYLFLLVEPLKEKAFLKALKGSENIELEQFGTIVGRGAGEPSDSLKERISANYNVIFS